MSLTVSVMGAMIEQCNNYTLHRYVYRILIDKVERASVHVIGYNLQTLMDHEGLK